MKVVTDQAGNARLVLDDLTAAAGRAEDATQDLAAASGKLNTSVGKVGAATKTAAQGMGRVGAASVLAGNNTRMLSMQLSQVAQQASATGNVTQALAIQAADIGMVFGTIGTVAGVLATVALPSLVSAFIDTGSGAKRAQEAVDEFGDSIGLYRSYVKTATADTATLTEEFGKWAGQIREFSDFMAGLSLGKAMEDLRTAIDPIAGKLMDVIHLVRQAQEEGANEDRQRVLMTQAQAIADSLGLSVQQAVDLAAAFERVQVAAKSGNIEAVAAATADAAAMMKAMFGETSRIPGPLREMAGLLHKVFEQTAAAAVETEALNNWWLQIKRAISDAVAGAPGSGWLAGAISDASTLAAELWKAAEAKAAVFDLTYGQTTGSGAWYAGMTAEQILPPKLFPGLEPPKATKGAAGVGGGGLTGTPGVEGLLQELQTEREILEQWYAESLAILEAANEAELAAIGGRNEAKLRMEQEYQDRMREIVAAERSVRMGEYADMFEGLASIAGAGGKKMLKAQATLSAVATLISGYEAAMKAAAEAVTIPGRIAAYAKFLGMGLSAVAQIRKAGGIGGATGAVTPAAPAMQQASPVNVSIQGINPASLYTGQQMIDLTTAVQKELKNRGVLFSYI